MENGKERIIDKIRKLLALATSPNENEAAMAAEKAQALLAEYNLTKADVETLQQTEDELFIEQACLTPCDPWRRQLGAVVAKLYFCKYYYSRHETVRPSGNIYRKDWHNFVGAKHNLVVAKMMFEYLMNTVFRLSNESAKGITSRRSHYVTSFRHAAVARLGARIMERIAEAKRGEMKSEGGTNLPALANLYDQAEQRNLAFLEQKLGGLVTKKSRAQMRSVAGAIAGDAAGQKIGLDTQLSGAGGKLKIEAH